MKHRIVVPELPPPSREDGLRIGELEDRFACLLQVMSGEWKVTDRITATRIVDGIEHHLVLTEDALLTSVSAVINGRVTTALGFVALISAAYFCHHVLNPLITAVVCLISFIATKLFFARALFVWPRRRQLDDAMRALDGEVTKHLGTTAGIVTEP